jgi:hypothetical protein
MDTELLIAAQIAQLFQRHPRVVWTLIAVTGRARPSDVPIQASDGTVLAYARPGADGYECRPTARNCSIK